MMKQAINEFLADNCTHLAAAISYYLMISIIPLTVAALAILGRLSQTHLQDTIINAISETFPFSKDWANETLRQLGDAWATASAIGFVGLIWAGTGIFNATRKSLNTAWGIKQSRPFLRERLIEFGMMLGLVVFLIVYLGMAAGFNFFETTATYKEHFANSNLFWQFISILASTIVAFIGFLLLYEFIPNTRTSWRHVWVGALIAAVLFEIVKDVFIWSVGNFLKYNLVYGSLSIIIALMTWSYISAVILLFCAKLISIYPRMKSSLLEEAHVETESVAKSDSEPPVSKFLFRSKTATKKKN